MSADREEFSTELQIEHLFGNEHGLFLRLPPGNRAVLLSSWKNFDRFIDQAIEIESHFVSLNGMQRFA
jgi:hypothetical protein